MKRLTMAVLLSIIPLLSGVGLTLHCDVQQGALVAQDTRFNPGVQLLASAGAGVGFGLGRSALPIANSSILGFNGKLTGVYRNG